MNRKKVREIICRELEAILKEAIEWEGYEMNKNKIKKLIREELNAILNVILSEKVGWENLPRGWTKESFFSFVESLIGKTPDDIKADEEEDKNIENFFSKCVDKLEDVEEITDASKMCASMKDTLLKYAGIKEPTKWR